jgi:cytosine/adenosine deaminase-related metal-dependent hydrolase/ubiquinone/menaquinone biosynthesis C-methylase UbiE
MAILAEDLWVSTRVALGSPVGCAAQTEEGESLAVPIPVNTNPLSSPKRTPVGEAFRLWSEIYDDQLSPLLNLEERFLRTLLPDLNGLSVLDVGCGTGRWLRALALRKPGVLVGIDNSPAMLARAVSKCGTFSDLILGEATSLPVSDSSFDLVLASFVVSYIGDLDSFASELRRVTRTGARVFLSDLHPETSAACGWRRAFRIGDSSIELDTRNWSLEQVVSCFEEAGFTATCLAEPHFGVAERNILEQAEKQDVYAQTAGVPPIYILQLQRAESRSISYPPACPLTATSRVALTGARVALAAEEGISADIVVSEKRISSIGMGCFTSPSPLTQHSIDLTGYLVLPGLINAHDHLEFGLYPNLGHGPYEGFARWADDIHQRDSAVIEQHRKVPKDVRLWWGAVRNLLCGVTTVCHHNPLSPALENDDFPVRVLSRFGWAHSISMDPELARKFHSTSGDVPFFLHVAEGVSDESASEVFQLDRMHALDERTVVVHGLALREGGMKLVNRRGAALVWCPSSNYFLFGNTHTQESISSAERVVLGSDSPLTAAGDLLDEIRFAHNEVGVTPRELYPQVTSRSAEVLRLKNGEGTLRPGAMADLIGVRNTGLNPAATLAQLSYRDIELVLLGGRVQLASESIMARLPDEIASGLRPLEVEKTVRWIRAPLGRLFGEAEKVLGCGLRIGGKTVHNILTEWL